MLSGPPPLVLSVWNVPYSRNVNFTGRESVLRGMREGFLSSDPLRRAQAIHGLGGVGKTQVALEYAYRYREEYPIVWWVRAEEPTTMLGDFLGLGERLFGGTVKAEPEAVAEAVKRALDNRLNWLLILDNVPGSYAVGRVLPQGRSGHIIITSRNPNWRGVAQPLLLRPWERREAIEFLRKRTGMEEGEAAGMLAEALGDLPLALEQAGACIEQARITVGQYLERYQTHRRELMQITQPGTDYSETVATTWEISFNKIGGASRVSKDLLSLISFLAPDGIPRDLLTAGEKVMPYPLAGVVKDAVSFDGAVASLLLYSLIDANEKTISLHRLVAAVTRDRMDLSERVRWAEVAVRLINDAFAFESIDVGTWGQCSNLLPQVMAVTAHAEALEVAPEVTAALLNEAGRYLLKRGQYLEAKGVLERALKLARGVYGDQHPGVSAIVNNLGRVCQRMGQVGEAKQYFEWAVAIDEPAFGHDHPHVATVVNNYGLCLMAGGEVATAKEKFEWALAVFEKTSGVDHPKLASVVNNLGYAMKTMGDLQGAHEQFRRALEMAERKLGPKHPTVASILHNLGDVARGIGNLESARSYFERAMGIDRAVYGPGHPDVARDVDYLGQVLKGMGDVEGERKLYEEARAEILKECGQGHRRAKELEKKLGMVAMTNVE
ncbi:MAG TPA: FxSxx-COOH system tetratricopeptide repeat protein [Tepidisphaeraceae bacterium]|jgi:Tfp pilus assembly protein PilF|nr:FxSxx-COOH system tetratricopeptide repeat protein [Tepidisphaeraceae bacterium]